MAAEAPKYVLYTYFRSSCSGRVRIALNLKNIPYDSKPVNVVKGEHKSEEYHAVNPLGFVPALQIQSNSGAGTIITQSLAILEYLEDQHPNDSPLLPPQSDIAGRAHVRALSSLIACDVQPVTNERILKRVASMQSGEDKVWAKWLMDDGFEAYEKLASTTAGKFSYGDSITMADVCLVPAVWRAARCKCTCQETLCDMAILQTDNSLLKLVLIWINSLQ